MGESEAAVIYCSRCGQQNPQNNYKCEACGNVLHLSGPVRVKPEEDDGPPIGDRPGMRMLLPVGRSGWAIAAGYLGLVSLFTGVVGPFSIAISIVAIADIKKNPHRHGMGRAVFGIIGGVIGITWFALLLAADFF